MRVGFDFSRIVSAYWYTWLKGSIGCDTNLGLEFYAVHGCCCSGLAAFLTAILRVMTKCSIEIQVYDVPTFRIGVSLLELTITIMFESC